MKSSSWTSGPRAVGLQASSLESPTRPWWQVPHRVFLLQFAVCSLPESRPGRGRVGSGPAAPPAPQSPPGSRAWLQAGPVCCGLRPRMAGSGCSFVRLAQCWAEMGRGPRGPRVHWGRGGCHRWHPLRRSPLPHPLPPPAFLSISEY